MQSSTDYNGFVPPLMEEQYLLVLVSQWGKYYSKGRVIAICDYI